jgi:hypothetical protein
LSWVLLLVLATRTPFVLGLPALGWLHLVVLGWLTMTASADMFALVMFRHVEHADRGSEAQGVFDIFWMGPSSLMMHTAETGHRDGSPA